MNFMYYLCNRNLGKKSYGNAIHVLRANYFYVF